MSYAVLQPPRSDIVLLSTYTTDGNVAGPGFGGLDTLGYSHFLIAGVFGGSQLFDLTGTYNYNSYGAGTKNYYSSTLASTAMSGPTAYHSIQRLSGGSGKGGQLIIDIHQDLNSLDVFSDCSTVSLDVCSHRKGRCVLGEVLHTINIMPLSETGVGDTISIYGVNK